MWGGLGAALVGAGGSIVGGLLGNASRSSPTDHFADNAALQKEFAQNGIRWKVADAKAAGLHPLAALGAQTASFTPGYVGDTGSANDYSFLADAGQQIGRAIDAKATAEERARNRVYQEKANELTLENMQLQNDSIKMDMVRQLARDAERAVNTQQQVPAMPSFRTRADGATIMPGQGDATTSSLFKVKPPELVASHPETPYAEAGSHPEVKWARTALGGYTPVRSEALEEALEDDWLGGLRYTIRNSLGSATSSESFAPPRALLPDHGKTGRYSWMFDNYSGDWYAFDHSAGVGRKLVDTAIPFGRMFRKTFFDK